MTTSAPAVTIEDAGPCRKKVSIEIPGDTVGEKISAAFSELEGSVSLPGFRPGKVPRKLIEKRFGPQLREETKRQLVGEAYQAAVKDHELRIVGEPEGGDELNEATIEPGTPIAFSIHVEVAPEFDTPDVAGFEVKKPKLEITDEMIDEQIERACVNEGELEEQKKAGPGDYCVGHGVLTCDETNEQIHDIEGAVIQLPKDGEKGMILGVTADDFATQVGTPKKGDTVTVKATGPENHEVEAVRGKKLTATFEISEIQRVIPAAIDKVVARYGLADEEALRTGVKRQLDSRVFAQKQAVMRRQAATKLLEAVDFELPERLTANQAARNLQRRRMELMYQGVDPETIEEKLAEVREASNEVATRELKLFFILDKLANEHNVNITEQDVGGAIIQMAMARGVEPSQLRKELMESGQVQAVAQQVREHKTLDTVLDKAKVIEVDPDELSDEEKADA